MSNKVKTKKIDKRRLPVQIMCIFLALLMVGGGIMSIIYYFGFLG